MMEDVNARSQVAQTMHCGTGSGGPCNETTGLGSGLQNLSGAQTGYHTYASIIDRRTPAPSSCGSMSTVRYYTVNASQVDTSYWQQATDHGFFMILNVAMGGSFPDASWLQHRFDVRASRRHVRSGDVGRLRRRLPARRRAPRPPHPPPARRPRPVAGVAASQRPRRSRPRPTAASRARSSRAPPTPVAARTSATSPTVTGCSTTTSTSAPHRPQSRPGSPRARRRRCLGLVEVHLDSLSNPAIGSFALGNTGGWQTWTTIPTKPRGSPERTPCSSSSSAASRPTSSTSTGSPSPRSDAPTVARVRFAAGPGHAGPRSLPLPLEGLPCP